MGCSQSKIENVETVNRCKERKAFMKQSISARYAFATAHFAYAAALKNTGAALSDYAQGVLQLPNHLPPAPPHPPYGSLRPPPHPDSSDFKPHSDTIMEEVNEDDEIEDHGLKHRSSYRRSIGGRGRNGNSKREMENENLPPPPSLPRQSESNLDRATPPPPPPENDGISSWDFFYTSMEDVPGISLAEVDDKSSRTERAEIQRKVLENQIEHDGGGEIRSARGYSEVVEESEEEPPPSSMKGDVQNVNLLQVFTELDDCFVKASESAHEVSKILEANSLHYHSNFADNRGHIDHSTRVMRVITWNRSFKGPPTADDAKDDLASKENETHATVLDKMLAWEKKLYDEVKAQAMEATVGWCNSGCWSRIRSQYKTDYHVFINVSIDMGLKALIWRILWRRIKKEKNKKKKKVHGFSNSTQFSYDPSEYAQNFDQGLMLNDSDDLSRSFSARFAVPSTVFHNKGLTA